MCSQEFLIARLDEHRVPRDSTEAGGRFSPFVRNRILVTPVSANVNIRLKNDDGREPRLLLNARINLNCDSNQPTLLEPIVGSMSPYTRNRLKYQWLCSKIKHNYTAGPVTVIRTHLILFKHRSMGSSDWNS